MMFIIWCAGWFNANVSNDGQRVYGLEFSNYVQDYKNNHSKFATAAKVAFARQGLIPVFEPVPFQTFSSLVAVHPADE